MHDRKVMLQEIDMFIAGIDVRTNKFDIGIKLRMPPIFQGDF